MKMAINLSTGGGPPRRRGFEAGIEGSTLWGRVDDQAGCCEERIYGAVD
ncbi:hypothetical protein ACFONI_05425 [Aeromonas media]